MDWRKPIWKSSCRIIKTDTKTFLVGLGITEAIEKLNVFITWIYRLDDIFIHTCLLFFLHSQGTKF
jgi:hypothetical protein